MAFPTPNSTHQQNAKQGKIPAAPEPANPSQTTGSPLAPQPKGSDNRSEQAYSTSARPTYDYPSPCGAMNAKPRSQIVPVDLDNVSSILVQKLAILLAAREYGDGVFQTKNRYIEIHFGRRHLHIPIRPGIENEVIPAPAAQLQEGTFAQEVGRDFSPSQAQRDILAFLAGGKRIGYSDLKLEIGRWFVDRTKKDGTGQVVRVWGGNQELVAMGLLEQDEDRKFVLTELGELAARELKDDSAVE